MTTNITPIEALNEIIKRLAYCGYDENLRQIVKIAEQALAPQECDMTKCEFYDTNFDNNCSTIKCSKQLHSQQKTFTLEKIANILGKIESLNSNSVQKMIQKEIIAEFEKEMK